MREGGNVVSIDLFFSFGKLIAQAAVILFFFFFFWQIKFLELYKNKFIGLVVF